MEGLSLPGLTPRSQGRETTARSENQDLLSERAVVLLPDIWKLPRFR
jgi:hypothetical protein